MSRRRDRGIDMNLSAEKRRRKWAYGSIWQRGVPVVTAVTLFLGLADPAAAAAPKPFRIDDLFGAPPRQRGGVRAAKVPLPVPRPAEAPQAVPDNAKDNAEAGPAAEPEKAAEPAAPKAPEPSACRLALTEEIAIAPSIPDIHGSGGCGGEDLVRLEAVVLPNKHRVAVTPAATLRCKMASEISDWVRTDVVHLAAGLGSEPTVLDNFDSYECRGFNRIRGAHLSEHGRANALDVRAVKLANGQSIELTDRTVPRDLRERFLQSVCARFMTVLGPGSDWYHEEHIHLDLMERRNNYKICQWNVWDPLPRTAPLMPASRPEEAPPREVAGKAETDKGDTDEPKGDAKPAPAPAKPPTKKRR
jgi:hypothetical protein